MQQRPETSPFLRTRLREGNQNIPGVDQRGNRPIFSIMGVIGFLCLGLYLLLAAASMSSRSSESIENFLLKGDFKSAKLSQDQLESLVGAYYISNLDDNKSVKQLYDSGVIIVSREQFPENTRIIPKGSFVTMDFDEDRLNIHLNEDMYIKKAKYG